MASIHEDIIRYVRQSRDVYGPSTWVSSPVRGEVSRQEDTTVVSHEPWQSASNLTVLEALICSCMDCPLGSTRKNFVFGSGRADADLMVIGEAPGADEDEQGLPFVGRAGQLLTKILDAIDLPREDVYICNILKCRPPNNRKPQVAETDACEPYLWKQIDLVQPKIIIALGLTAANTLLKNKKTMRELRGETHSYQGIPMIVTYHPAALLRNPEWKKSTWEDVQRLQGLLAELP
jgi:uracil-DNA glycosylase